MVVTDAFYNIRSKNDHELLSNLHDVFDSNGRNQLHILHICTEMTPVASFGSLASYVTGFSLALQRKGNFVEPLLSPTHTPEEKPSFKK
ncbi:putative starch synthase 4 [Nymphaea thermarum]|nr:putative starch synthase 4 [Nymphaea thermarum]